MQNVSKTAVTLANGVQMPRIGFGTWPMNDAEVADAVQAALNAGYRLLDTAESYGNEKGVGEGMRQSGVPRDQIFVTTKFNREWHSLQGVRQACQASLTRLGLDYIDLLLIHWPNPQQDQYVEAFQGLQRLLDEGLVRAIGTSNFKVPHLRKLLAAKCVPHVNQIQLDPYHPRRDIVEFHQANGIVTECWSPLGRGGELLWDANIVQIARLHDRSPAQIVLRWHVQSGFVPIPKASNAQRRAENLQIFDFNLSDAEMLTLSGLEREDPEMLDADTFGL